MKSSNEAGGPEMDRLFVEDPESLYQHPDRISPEHRRSLFALEEGLVSCLSLQHTALPADRENEISQLADELRRTGSFPDSLARADQEAVLAAYFAGDLMSRTDAGRQELPEALRHVMGRVLAQDAQTEQPEVPALILHLGEGLRAVKSAWQGLFLEDETLLATRNAAIPSARTSHLVFSQSLPNSTARLQFQILAESDERLTLIVTCPDGYWKTRLALKQDGRTVDSQSFASGRPSLSFEHLTEGEYRLDFSGALEHSCSIVVRV